MMYVDVVFVCRKSFQATYEQLIEYTIIISNLFLLASRIKRYSFQIYFVNVNMKQPVLCVVLSILNHKYILSSKVTFCNFLICIKIYITELLKLVRQQSSNSTIMLKILFYMELAKNHNELLNRHSVWICLLNLNKSHKPSHFKFFICVISLLYIC